MNDGKTLNSISTKFYKQKGIIPKEQKEMSTQKCHLCYETNKADPKLLKYGMAPLHSCMRSTENILKASFKKRSNTHNISVKQAKQQICYEIKEATGARLFEPEPKTGGNSNTGVNLKTILNESSVTHEILDCSEIFLITLKQVRITNSWRTSATFLFFLFLHVLLFLCFCIFCIFCSFCALIAGA